jgi:hypothetical protein
MNECLFVYHKTGEILIIILIIIFSAVFLIFFLSFFFSFFLALATLWGLGYLIAEDPLTDRPVDAHRERETERGVKRLRATATIPSTLPQQRGKLI